MKKLFLIFLTILICVNLFAQWGKYKSKERDRYFKNFNYTPFKPLDTAFILSFNSEYYEIHDTEINYEPYSPDKHSTPYDKFYWQYLDSVFKTIPPNDNGYLDDFSYEEEIWIIKEEMGKIGKISKTQILIYEKKDSIEAFIYEDWKYEIFGGFGIWIGYSEDNGNSWNYYYTGIVQEQPLFIKYYSQRALIKEKGKLEIDACLIRQRSAFPLPGPYYECIKDGIFVFLDIDVLSKDTDGDGLPDIIEDKFYLNKYSEDTDGDGIPDFLDTNPRVYFPQTEKSKIYEALLNQNIDFNTSKLGTELLFKDDYIFVTDSLETIFIVTDSEDIMAIRPLRNRIIFMTNEEYQKRDNVFRSDFRYKKISPFLKVDSIKDAYIVYIGSSRSNGGCSYLIQKTQKGWFAKMISVSV